MICGALQTLNEEALEDVLQSEPPSHPGEPLRTIREHVPPRPDNQPPPANGPSSDVILNLEDADVFM